MGLRIISYLSLVLISNSLYSQEYFVEVDGSLSLCGATHSYSDGILFNWDGSSWTYLVQVDIEDHLGNVYEDYTGSNVGMKIANGEYVYYHASVHCADEFEFETGVRVGQPLDNTDPEGKFEFQSDQIFADEETKYLVGIYYADGTVALTSTTIPAGVGFDVYISENQAFTVRIFKQNADGSKNVVLNGASGNIQSPLFPAPEFRITKNNGDVVEGVEPDPEPREETDSEDLSVTQESRELTESNGLYNPPDANYKGSASNSAGKQREGIMDSIVLSDRNEESRHKEHMQALIDVAKDYTDNGKIDNTNAEARHREALQQERNIWNRKENNDERIISELKTNTDGYTTEMQQTRDEQQANFDRVNENLETGLIDEEGGSHMGAIREWLTGREDETDWQVAASGLISQGTALSSGHGVPENELPTGGVSASSTTQDPWNINNSALGTIDFNPIRSLPSWVFTALAIVREIILWAVVIYWIKETFEDFQVMSYTALNVRGQVSVVGDENIIPGVPQVKALAVETVIAGVIVAAIAGAMLFMSSNISALVSIGGGNFGNSMAAVTGNSMALNGYLSDAWNIMDLLLPMAAIVISAVTLLVAKVWYYVFFLVAAIIVRYIKI